MTSMHGEPIHEDDVIVADKVHMDHGMMPLCYVAEMKQRGFTQAEIDDAEWPWGEYPDHWTTLRDGVTCTDCLEWLHA